MDRTRLLELAPPDLEIRRKDRFDGSGHGVRLADFAPDDIERIRRLYAEVKGIYTEWLESRGLDGSKRIVRRIERFDRPELYGEVHAIGQSTRAQLAEEARAMRQALHDIRGGSLNGLLGVAQLMKMDTDAGTYARKGVFLARDHAKIMRNAIEDLDPDERAADEREKAHHISDIVEKLGDLRYGHGDGRVNVRIECDFDGYISNRCLETSSIDRILYNFINNAARFAADGDVHAAVFPVNEAIIRFVVSNAVSPDQEAWLNQHVGGTLDCLFQGGITRGGAGVGLSVCADFVSSSFGVHPPGRAVERGYIGAKLAGGVFHAWFHWPVLRPAD